MLSEDTFVYKEVAINITLLAADPRIALLSAVGSPENER